MCLSAISDSSRCLPIYIQFKTTYEFSCHVSSTIADLDTIHPLKNKVPPPPPPPKKGKSLIHIHYVHVVYQNISQAN